MAAFRSAFRSATFLLAIILPGAPAPIGPRYSIHGSRVQHLPSLCTSECSSGVVFIDVNGPYERVLVEYGWHIPTRVTALHRGNRRDPSSMIQVFL